MNATARKTVAIDFDGVIHRYSRGWQDGSCYDEPVPGAHSALGLLASTYKLVVFTARDELDTVAEWLQKHDLAQFIDQVTNQKPPAWIYIDDRGLRFADWQQALNDLASIAPHDEWRELDQAEEAE